VKSAAKRHHAATTRNSLFDPTLRIDPSSRPARTRPLAAVFSRSFQSSSSLALEACSFLVARNQSIDPACALSCGANSRQWRQQETDTPQSDVSHVHGKFPFQEKPVFLELTRIVPEPRESQRYRTFGVTPCGAPKCRPVSRLVVDERLERRKRVEAALGLAKSPIVYGAFNL